MSGDLNSIRRMAFYYRQNQQAAPYDIVLMGMIENDGAMARVPAVPRDERRQGAQSPEWLTAATPAQAVRIAGRCPWLRQGWDFLSAPEDVERSMVHGLDGFRTGLTASIFTTFKNDAGRALAEKWGLRPNL